MSFSWANSAASAVVLAAITVAGDAAVITMPNSRQGTAPKDVATIYRQHCAHCHGAALHGGRASSLVDGRWASRSDDDSIAKSIREEHNRDDVLRVDPQLSEAEIRALVIYIREREARREAGPAWSVDIKEPVVKTEQHSFQMQTVVAEVEEPWSLAFLPDGRMLITERAGRLRVVEQQRLLAEPVSGLPVVWARGQGGLLDVAVHPKYADSGWIYLTYSEPGPGSSAMTTLVRGRLVENTWVQQRALFKLPAALFRISQVHFGSRIAFDRNGHLYFSVGDRGFSEDAQDLTRPNGKIHRIADDGGVPDDNPIVGVVNGLRTIWSYGNRNPQGLAFHPVTGDLWEVEQGPRGGDELNRILPGGNYGWPLVSEGLNYDGTPILPPKSTEGLEHPVHHWTPSITVSSMAFYTGDKFSNWKNNLFVTSLTYQDVRRLVIENDRVTHEEILFKNFGRVRTIVNGPDGYLYVVLNAPDRVARLIPAPGK
jgi:glucose/arabinose dehydrogenase